MQDGELRVNSYKVAAPYLSTSPTLSSCEIFQGGNGLHIYIARFF